MCSQYIVLCLNCECPKEKLVFILPISFNQLTGVFFLFYDLILKVSCIQIPCPEIQEQNILKLLINLLKVILESLFEQRKWEVPFALSFSLLDRVVLKVSFGIKVFPNFHIFKQAMACRHITYQRNSWTCHVSFFCTCSSVLLYSEYSAQ